MNQIINESRGILIGIIDYLTKHYDIIKTYKIVVRRKNYRTILKQLFADIYFVKKGDENCFHINIQNNETFGLIINNLDNIGTINGKSKLLPWYDVDNPIVIFEYNKNKVVENKKLKHKIKKFTKKRYEWSNDDMIYKKYYQRFYCLPNGLWDIYCEFNILTNYCSIFLSDIFYVESIIATYLNDNICPVVKPVIINQHNPQNIVDNIDIIKLQNKIHNQQQDIDNQNKRILKLLAQLNDVTNDPYNDTQTKYNIVHNFSTPKSTSHHIDTQSNYKIDNNFSTPKSTSHHIDTQPNYKIDNNFSTPKSMSHHIDTQPNYKIDHNFSTPKSMSHHIDTQPNYKIDYNFSTPKSMSHHIDTQPNYNNSYFNFLNPISVGQHIETQPNDNNGYFDFSSPKSVGRQVDINTQPNDNEGHSDFSSPKSVGQHVDINTQPNHKNHDKDLRNIINGQQTHISELHNLINNITTKLSLVNKL